MKKLSRILLILLGAILGVAVLILIGVNMYVQSQGTQARIQQELSQRLGTTLQVRRISVTPWAGLKLSGITIPQSQPGVSADFLTAKTFRLRIKFGSLFSGRLVIKEISLINPDVVWAQNADGKWRVPSMPQETALNGPPPATTELAVVPKEVAQQDTPVSESDLPGPDENETPVPFTPEIQRVNLVRGRFRFLDEKLKSVATFDDVHFRSSFRTATDLRGNISIGKTSLRDRFFLEQLQSPLRYAPDELDFSQITARAGGGEIAGRFTLLPQTEDSPFTVSIKFRDVQADRIVTDAGGIRGMITGRLEGYLDASGTTADQNALAGAGEIILRDGQVQQYSLLVALGQLLQIAELQKLQFDQAQVKYHLNPGVVTIDELLFRSQNIRLSATGTVSFDGKLQLESQLAVNEKMRSQLFRAIRENFQPIDEPGYSAVSFQVSGTVGRPKTNLMDKLIGRDLKDLGSVIDSLIGGGKPEKAKKKKTAEAAAPVSEPSVTSPPAESASPAASATVTAHASAERVAMRVIAGDGGRHSSRCPENRCAADDGPGESGDFFQPRRGNHRRARSRPLRRNRRVGHRSAQPRRGVGFVRGRRMPRRSRPSSGTWPEPNWKAVSANRMSLRFFVRHRRREPFRIIFADPPYEKTKSGGEFTRLLLQDTRLAEVLEPSGIFVLEKRPSEQMPPMPLWNVIRARAYGATEVLFLQRAQHSRRATRALNDQASLQSSLSARSVASFFRDRSPSCCGAEITGTSLGNASAFMIATCKRASPRAAAPGFTLSAWAKSRSR